MRGRRVLLACLPLSGATGLAYEILWMRMVALAVGNTTHATSTVLAVFFCGLAAGSTVFGRAADRVRRPVRLYALLELCIAVLGVLSGPMLGWLARTQLDGPWLWVAIVGTLLPASVLLGGTFPVVAVALTGERGEGLHGVGVAYAAQTVGGVSATILSSLVVMPWLGQTATLLATAGLNVAAALVAAVFVRDAARVPSPPPSPSSGRSLPGPALAVLLGFGVSGGCSLVNEVAWTRALTLVLGSSTYALAIILATFLAGMALGSVAFAAIVRPDRAVEARTFAWIEIGLGLAAVAIVPCFDALPHLFLRLGEALGYSFHGLLVVELAVSGCVILLPALLVGASFPCAIRACERALESVGRGVGDLYAVNTVGGVAGARLAGFVLVPRLGTQHTLVAAALTNAAVGALVVLAAGLGERKLTRGMGLGLAGATALIALTLPSWNRHLMVSGTAVNRPSYLGLPAALSLEHFHARARILFLEEGTDATVSVHETQGKRYLRINGKTDAGSGDMHTQLMAGHLPMLVHAAPSRVLVVGLGSGITAGAVAEHPVRSLDVVEIEPAVVRAAAFFSEANHGVLADSRVHLTVADSRRFLRTAGKSYDVITSEPSNPWIAGMARMFTREYFEAAKARLAPGGVFCEWVPTYGIEPDDVRLVVRTFAAAFPHTTLWQTDVGDLFMIGTADPLVVDLARWERLAESPAVRRDLEALGFGSPLALLSDFLLDESDVPAFAGDGAAHTDDLPRLEFSTVASLYRDDRYRILAMLREARHHDLPAIRGWTGGAALGSAFPTMLASALLAHEDYDEALRRVDQALAIDASYLPALMLRARIDGARGQWPEAEADLLRAVAAARDDVGVLVELARLYHGRGHERRAREVLERALSAHPEAASALDVLGDVLMSTGDVAAGVAAFRRAVAASPREPRFKASLARALMVAGAPAEALPLFREASALVPEDGELQLGLAIALDQQGSMEEASRHYDEAVSRDPTLTAAYVGRARCHLLRGDRRAALHELETAASIDPENSAVQALRLQMAR